MSITVTQSVEIHQCPPEAPTDQTQHKTSSDDGKTTESLVCDSSELTHYNVYSKCAELTSGDDNKNELPESNKNLSSIKHETTGNSSKELSVIKYETKLIEDTGKAGGDVKPDITDLKTNLVIDALDNRTVKKELVVKNEVEVKTEVKLKIESPVNNEVIVKNDEDSKNGFDINNGLVEEAESDLGQSKHAGCKTVPLQCQMETRESQDQSKLKEKYLESPKSPTLISKQREKILNMRRRHKSLDGRNKGNLVKGQIKFDDIKRIDASCKAHSKELNNDCKKRKKHKRIRRYRSHDEFSDIFSEPLNVKSYQSHFPAKREHKIPSRFIYLSKMEQNMNECTRKRLKQRNEHRSKYEQCENLICNKEDLNVRKVKAETNVGVKVEEGSDGNYSNEEVKVFMMKDGKSTSVFKHHVPQREAHLASSSVSSSQKSSKTSRKLRDSHFYQHCLKRYYRLKASNWNRSSKDALRLLKRKYNSVKLLFHSEPVVCLKPLRLKTSAIKINSLNSSVRWSTMGNREPEKCLLNLKQESHSKNYVYQEKANKLKSETRKLVDPRVMSLSRTLQSGNRGQVGLDKIFKSSKTVKTKSKCVSPKEIEKCKKKNKQDWSTWRERLKEASLKMINKKPDGQVVERNINAIPNLNFSPTPLSKSLLHFRIPLKSRCKISKPENETSDLNGEEKTSASMIGKNSNDNTQKNDESVEENMTDDIYKSGDKAELPEDLNEELTIEEYEDDSIRGFSINGFSIEMNRECTSEEIGFKESSAVNECFDEAEIDKILFGDSCDNVEAACCARNGGALGNDSDANMTLTSSDGIPNLCSQEELGYRDHDFSEEVDMSPPVLEKLTENTINSDTANTGENSYCENKLKEDCSLKEKCISDETVEATDVCVADSENTLATDEPLPIVIQNVCSLRADKDISDYEQEYFASDGFDSPTRIKEKIDENELTVNSTGVKAPSLKLNENCSNSTEMQDGSTKHNKTIIGIFEKFNNEMKSPYDFLRTNPNNTTEIDTKLESISDYPIGMQLDQTDGNRQMEAFNNVVSISNTKTENNKGTVCEVKTPATHAGSVITVEANQDICDRNLRVEEIAHNYQANRTAAKSENRKELKESRLNHINKHKASNKTKPNKPGIALMQTGVVDNDNNSSGLNLVPVVGGVSGRIVDATSINVNAYREVDKPDKYVKEEESTAFRKQGPMMPRRQKVGDVSEKQSSGVKEMELNEERLMRDFPNHNWLFNKYNIADVAIDTPTGKDVKETLMKGKKQKKDEKEVSQKASDNTEPKTQRKSTKSTGEVQINQQKPLALEEDASNKTEFTSTEELTQNDPKTLKDPVNEESKKKSDKVKKCKSDTNGGILVEKDDNYNCTASLSERNSIDDHSGSKEIIQSSKYGSKYGCDPLLSQNVKTDDNITVNSSSNVDTEDNKSECDKDLSDTVLDLSVKKKVNDIDLDTSDETSRLDSDLQCDSFPQMQDDTSLKQFNIQHTCKMDISCDSVETAVYIDKNKELDSECHQMELDESNYEVQEVTGVDNAKSYATPLKNADDKDCELFGSATAAADDDDNDDDDCDDFDDEEKKLEIDEGACMEDDADDIEDKVDIPDNQPGVITEKSETNESCQDNNLMITSDTSEQVPQSDFKVPDHIEGTENKELDTTATAAAAATYTGSAGGSETIREQPCEVRESEEKCGEARVAVEERADDLETVNTSTLTSGLTETGKSKPENTEAVTVKTEASSISFRQRTKPPVQLVHPQVHKPPGKIKVEAEVTPDIEPSNSSHPINKQVLARITSERCSPRINEAPAVRDVQISSCLNPSVTSVVKTSASCQVPVSILPTLPTSSGTPLTTSLSTAFASGVIIPIQPFVQTVTKPQPQRYVLNEPQQQLNINHAQSSSIRPVFQQSAPVPIQSHLIPVSLVQTANQQLISNYSLADCSTSQKISSQSVPVNINQQRIDVNTVRSTMGTSVNTGPPPLLLLPKHSGMTVLSQDKQQLPLQSCTTQILAQKYSNTSENTHNCRKVSEQQCISEKVHIDTNAGIDSVNQISSSDKFSGSPSSTGNVEDEEIKKQMEELDKEIKRKEQEQEEMRRRKIELLQKMKQSKSAKPTELKRKEPDFSELEKNVEEQPECTQIIKTEMANTCFNEALSKDSEKISIISSTTAENQKEPEKQDGVITEVSDNNCEISSVPMDLSNTIKFKQDVLGKECSLTVKDGVLSIQETTETSPSDSENNIYEQENETNINITAKEVNKNDGINYIEDIGLVNPFTGEYEINEDIEGVEYLDLSKSKKVDDNSENQGIENTSATPTNQQSKDSEGDLTQNQESDIKQECSISLVSKHEPVISYAVDKPNQAIDESFSSVSINSEQEKSSVMTVAKSSSSVSLLSLSVTTVTSSYAQESVSVPTSVVTSGQPTLISQLTVSSSSHDSERSADLNTTSNLEKNDEALNLVKVKSPSNEEVTQNQVSCLTANDEKSDGQLERNVLPQAKSEIALRRSVDLLTPSSSQSCTVSPSNEVNPHKQGDVITANLKQSAKVTNQQTHHNDSNRMNPKPAAHNSRGPFRKRLMKENVIEIKPAHYRSPPRKIQKGAKIMPAHCQKATSRETMKKMCKVATAHHHPEQISSPYILRKQPNYLSPKEINKPSPRQWEKKMPKPAHSKRPFGIAGHLIVQTAKKRRTRTISEDKVPTPEFCSLPSTPTSPGMVPPRATSADYHGSASPVQISKDNQRLITSPSTISSRFEGNNGAPLGPPSPIKAHCRPRSLVSADQFYETSVLRPPTISRDQRSHNQAVHKDTSEIIDLTAEIVPSRSKPNNIESVTDPSIKERAIQNELNRAVSKRQRVDTAESLPSDRSKVPVKNTAVRSKQIMNKVAMMPPPPYVGRQRMPVLLQVPRDQAVFEQNPRIQYDRRSDENTLRERMEYARMLKPPQRQATIPIPEDAQYRSQMAWGPQPGDQMHEQRLSYAPRMIRPGMPVRNPGSGQEQFHVNQDMVYQRGSSHQPMYQSRDQPPGNMGMVYSNNVAQHQNMASPVRGQVRGQMMQYAGGPPQNQSEVHQLLQQPHPMNTHRVDAGQRMMVREPSPHMMHGRKPGQSLNITGNISPEMMQRRMNSQNVSPSLMTSSLVHATQASNIPTMQTTEIHQASFPQNKGPPMLQVSNLNPDRANGMVMVDQQGQIIQDTSHLGSNLGTRSTLSPEQRFQRMQQIRAQHIRSQQFQNRSQPVSSDPVTRVQDVRGSNFEQVSRMSEAISSHQQLPGYNTGLSYQSAGSGNPTIPTTTYSQSVAVLDNHPAGRMIQPQPQPLQRFPGPGSINHNAPPAGIQRQTVVLTTTPHTQTHQTQFQKILPAPQKFHQNIGQNNVTPVRPVQQSVFIQPNGYVTSDGMQHPAVFIAQNQGPGIQAECRPNMSPPGPMNIHLPRHIQPKGGPQNASAGNQVAQTNVIPNTQNFHDNIRGQFQNQRQNFPPPSQHSQGVNTYQTHKPVAPLHAAHQTTDHVASQRHNNTSYKPNIQPGQNSARTPENLVMDLTGNKAQYSPQFKGQLKESQGEKLEEDLPHLQQVHGECIICGKYSLYLCSNCKKIWYCSPECQLTHWQTHALECEGQTV